MHSETVKSWCYQKCTVQQ